MTAEPGGLFSAPQPRVYAKLETLILHAVSYLAVHDWISDTYYDVVLCPKFKVALNCVSNNSPLMVSALQNAVIDGQETPLRLSFAKDKPSERPPPISSLASDALQVFWH